MNSSHLQQHIRCLTDIGQNQASLFGEKTVQLVEFAKKLHEEERISEGFALSTELYWDFLNSNSIRKKIKSLIVDIDITDTEELKKQSQKVRRMIRKATWGKEQKQQITQMYTKVFGKQRSCAIVRSSAVAQNTTQEQFSHIHGTEFSIGSSTALLEAIQEVYASLFTEEAIMYRHQKGYGHMHVALSILVQKQYVPILSGTIYPVDISSGFDQVSTIESVYGTHELLHAGTVQPDQFLLFRPGIQQEKSAIISKKLGSKKKTRTLQLRGGGKTKNTKKKQAEMFSLTDEQLYKLGDLQRRIHSAYKTPQIVQWSFDSKGSLIISQLSPYLNRKPEHHVVEQYTLKKESTVFAQGMAIGKGIVVGKPVVVNSLQEKHRFQAGNILVTKNTDSRFNALIQKASALILEEGSTSSHAAIMARERGILCVFGIKNAREIFSKKKQITIDHAREEVEAKIYAGALPYEIHRTELSNFSKTKTKTFMQVSDPSHAFLLSKLPHDGIGVLETSFIFETMLKAHPCAFFTPQKISTSLKKQLESQSLGYQSLQEYATQVTAQSIAAVAAAAYPKPVLLQLGTESASMKKLQAGELYEPIVGEKKRELTGAERMLNSQYRAILELTCTAFKRVRLDWGLDNVHVVLPECRSPEEGQQLLDVIQNLGIVRGERGLKVQVCCDLPSNLVLVNEFVKQFDGLQVSTNTLSVATLAKHPQSHSVESELAVIDAEMKSIIKKVVKSAHRRRKPVNIYGQAASDSAEFRDFLVQQGVHSVSLSPDKLIESKRRVIELEKTVGRYGKNRTHYSSLVALSLFAVFGSLLITVGVGCTGPEAEVHNDDTYVSPAALRMQAEEREKQRAQEQKEEQTSRLEIEDFAQFSVEYPSGWKVRYWNDGVTVQDPETKEYMSIYKKLVNPYSPDGQKKSIIVSGMPALRLDVQGQQNTVSLVEIQSPQRINSDGQVVDESGQEILIEGNQEIIDRFLASFQFGTSSDAVLGRDLNEWDQKDGRFCAQVITYARNNPEDECTLFSSPCAIPDNWQICEGNSLNKE